MQVLTLGSNKIGDAGMQALSTALASGAMAAGAYAAGAYIFLRGTNVTEAGMQALLDAGKVRGITVFF